MLKGCGFFARNPQNEEQPVARVAYSRAVLDPRIRPPQGSSLGHPPSVRKTWIGLVVRDPGLRPVDLDAVDGGVVQLQQSALDRDTWLTLLVPTFVGEEVGVDVAKLEGHDDLLFAIDRVAQRQHALQGLAAPDDEIEAGVVRCVAIATQGVDAAGMEGFALPGCDLPDAVEVTDAGHMQVEMSLLRRGVHGGLQKKRGDHRHRKRGEWSPRGVRAEARYEAGMNRRNDDEAQRPKTRHGCMGLPCSKRLAYAARGGQEGEWCTPNSSNKIPASQDIVVMTIDWHLSCDAVTWRGRER